MPALQVADSLRRIDVALYAYHPAALHFLARCFRRTPDGFSRELKAEHAETLAHALSTRRVLQRLLPREAANDLPSLPGAA